MENEYEGRNRRMSERTDVAFTLIYNVDNPYSLRISSLGIADDIDALMINLSDIGMAITTKYNLPIGTKLYIKFNVIDLHVAGDDRWRHMEITGEVVSNIILTDVNSKISHRLGMRFINISSEDKIAISDFVKRNRLPPKRPEKGTS